MRVVVLVVLAILGAACAHEVPPTPHAQLWAFEEVEQPPAEYARRLVRVQGVWAEPGDGGAHRVLDDDGQLALRMPAEALGWTPPVGTSVVYTLQRGQPVWGAPVQRTQRLATDGGAVLFASAQGASPRGVAGLEASWAGVRRWQFHSCATVVHRAVDFTGDDGTTRIGPGRRGRVGPFEIAVRRSSEQRGESRCSDWGGDAFVVWLRRVQAP